MWVSPRDLGVRQAEPAAEPVAAAEAVVVGEGARGWRIAVFW